MRLNQLLYPKVRNRLATENSVAASTLHKKQSIMSSQSLNQRQRYADAFLKRCIDLVPPSEIITSFDRPEIERYSEGDPGAYLAVWLKRCVPSFQRCACDVLPQSRHSHSKCFGCGQPADIWKWCLPEEVTDENLDQWALAEHDFFTVSPCLRDSDLNFESDFKRNILAAALRGSQRSPHVPAEYFPLAVQVYRLAGPRTFVTDLYYTGKTALKLMVYTKERAWMWEVDNIGQSNEKHLPYAEWLAHGLCPFLKIPDCLNPSLISSSASTVGSLPQQHGTSDCDVWSFQLPQAVTHIKHLCDNLAHTTNDRPIPKYQMIIDPNQCVRTRKSDGKTVWVPSEFDVATDGTVEMVGGERGHWMNMDAVQQVSTPILEHALPLLARLKKPHLLLEGQRLQVVVKAQRIILPPSQENTDAHGGDNSSTAEYVGLWHVDGEHEAVVAVVLFYYHVDSVLHGGNMEFIDRRPIDVIGSDYCDENYRNFDQRSLRRALRATDQEGPGIPNCSVPIDNGTLLVFSNYQMAHRVLRMVNTSTEHSASRDFVVLFILDPASDPLVPARCHLAQPFLYERLITGIVPRKSADNGVDDDDNLETLGLCRDSARLILEFMGLVPSLRARRQVRNALLLSQLQPKGRLGSSMAPVACTGNGCFTMIGWLNSMLLHDADDRASSKFSRAELRTRGLNMPPRQVGRGLSETLSVPSSQLGSYLGNESRENLSDFSD